MRDKSYLVVQDLNSKFEVLEMQLHHIIKIIWDCYFRVCVSTTLSELGSTFAQARASGCSAAVGASCLSGPQVHPTFVVLFLECDRWGLSCACVWS